MAQPQPRRTAATRATRATSILSTAPSEASLPTSTSHLAPPYTLPPTIPSPFTGTLEASLDAILDFARLHPELLHLTTPLLQDVAHSTNWPELFLSVLATLNRGREALEAILFLVTRKLLPEQIKENRDLMYRMYSAKRGSSLRITLRYDMHREWTKRSNAHHIVVESCPPSYPAHAPPPPLLNAAYPDRPPLMPNIIPTLIVAPVAEGYPTKKLAEAMKHHGTELDRWLLLSDEEVEAWDARRLVLGAASAVIMWQWVREGTEMLGEMEVRGWGELEGRAEECAWVRDM